jgi:hypothetical protein
MSERIFLSPQPKSLDELMKLKDEAIRGVANAYEAGDPIAFERATTAFEELDFLFCAALGELE